MAELVRAQPAFKVEFLASLGLDVLSTMGLTCVVHDFEGLHEWLVETAASLPARLRHDMHLCFRLASYPYIVTEAIASRVARDSTAKMHDDINALVAAIQAFSIDDCRSLLGEVLQRAAARNDIPLERPIETIMQDQESLELLIEALDLPLDLGEALNLLQEPLEWRDLLVSTIQRFWERVFRAESGLQQPQRERSVAYHRVHGYSAHFPEYFATVTGRLLPDSIKERMHEISHVRFVPSQYIGPYLSFLFNVPLLTVFYNSRATPADGDEVTERIQGMYQPLAALADKTRLQIMSLLRGRELYAQEIVNMLDIHQSAVSRHLKLMETSGVLTVRREKGAKFYSINRQRIEEISKRLNELLG